MIPDIPRAADDGTAPHSGKRLVIADDDAFVRSALSLQLNSSFAVVGDARDADEAIERVDALRPDVVIVDVEMPAGGGLRATREIRSRAPEVAIVALSSDESDSIVRAMLRAGAMTYVRKGIDGHQLNSILRSAIDAHTTLFSENASCAPGPPAGA
jgi:DNA-binding NarL/FixJ family response regulator